MSWQPLLALPARLLAPLLLLLLALLLSGAHYLIEVHKLGAAAETQAAQRLRDRLGVEQTRLETQLGQGNLLEVRRLVPGLALHEGVSHGWLVDGEGRVVAALARLELGRPLAEALAGQTPPLRQAALDAVGEKHAAIQIVPIAGEPALLGSVRIQPNHHLLLRVDLTHSLATGRHEARGELWREVATFMLLSALMALLLHVLWFSRVGLLTATVAELGAGRLDARARLAGRDELAEIGAAIDRMAEEMQRHHGQLQRLSTLIAHSPVVAIAWQNAPGWPVSFVSENIRQWGYGRDELLSGRLHYATLIHPDDLPRIEADVAAHLAAGPDVYRQKYRLRHADGHWLWIVDRTWLTRDVGGAVTAIEGVLVDISEQHRLEEAERQQSESLRQQNAELERFNRAMVGRELDMVRLKEQLAALSRRVEKS
ncbi:MAG: PAS domain-containing protein [Rhodocyclaceae bacterium]|nr:PAS domain-containing protein [Rhodocyclaceae bacterium]